MGKEETEITEEQITTVRHSIIETIKFLDSLTFSGYENAVRLKNAVECMNAADGLIGILSPHRKENESK